MLKANELIVKLEGGVDALIEKASGLSNQVEFQNDTISDLNSQVKELKAQIETQNFENAALKVKVSSSNSDTVDLDKYKTKINELVKEIDSCISLLNG